MTVIENPLEKLLPLRGVMFDWNEEHGGGHDIGFVAEEVGAVIPEAELKARVKRYEDLEARLKSLETLRGAGQNIRP